MITWNQRIIIMSTFFAHLTSAGPVTTLEHHLREKAHKLKEQYHKILKDIDYWRERQLDAIPKEFMTEARKQAYALSIAQAKRVEELKHQRSLLAGQLLHIKAQEKRIQEQLHQCDHSLQDAEAQQVHFEKNSHEWRQRSTSERTTAKLDALESEKRAIVIEYNKLPLAIRYMYPL